MPDVLTRYPLQPLSMSATQRSKRKTASRVNFDEDDGGLPLQKKSKVDSDAPQTNGKANGLPNKRSKAGTELIWLLEDEPSVTQSYKKLTKDQSTRKKETGLPSQGQQRGGRLRQELRPNLYYQLQKKMSRLYPLEQREEQNPLLTSPPTTIQLRGDVAQQDYPAIENPKYPLNQLRDGLKIRHKGPRPTHSHRMTIKSVHLRLAQD
jgi:hypothetical protein